jgi:polyisoprenoid-binding protein YceI
MNFKFRVRSVVNVTLCGSGMALALWAADAPTQPKHFAAQSGSVKFFATTNVSAVSIHGQSNEVQAQASVSFQDGQLLLSPLSARVDPRTLNTGMALRDNHMRDKIFSDGNTPAKQLQFQSGKAICPEPAKAKESICQIQGSFSLRGIEKPFAMPLRIKAEGNRYRMSGEGSLKMSDYGITAPCQLGVCVNDVVKFKLDLIATETTTLSQSAAASRSND